MNRFLRAGFTAREIELLWARCLSPGGADPIWKELQEAYRISNGRPPANPQETS